MKWKKMSHLHVVFKEGSLNRYLNVHVDRVKMLRCFIERRHAQRFFCFLLENWLLWNRQLKRINRLPCFSWCLIRCNNDFNISNSNFIERSEMSVSTWRFRNVYKCCCCCWPFDLDFYLTEHKTGINQWMDKSF